MAASEAEGIGVNLLDTGASVRTLVDLFAQCTIRGRTFAPARFCAPLAGYTHGAFRRLLAELGGCGALWTEMLAARQILAENFAASPWLRRPEQKTPLFYQLMVNAGDPIEEILERMLRFGVDALDLNLACNARLIRSCKAGSALFDDFEALHEVIYRVRANWPGVLTVKIRFGHDRPGWQQPFIDRLRLFEEAGIDAVVLHARFFEDKFKRRSRPELFPWASGLTKLPIIANGSIAGLETLEGRRPDFEGVSAIMLGRVAIMRPWVFASWGRAAQNDPGEIWHRMSLYIEQDFRPPVALRRLQMFTKYFASNFKFGHQFNVSLANAKSLPEIRARAEDFFSRGPELLPITATIL